MRVLYWILFILICMDLTRMSYDTKVPFDRGPSIDYHKIVVRSLTPLLYSFCALTCIVHFVSTMTTDQSLNQDRHEELTVPQYLPYPPHNQASTSMIRTISPIFACNSICPLSIELTSTSSTPGCLTGPRPAGLTPLLSVAALETTSCSLSDQPVPHDTARRLSPANTGQNKV